MNPGHSRMRYLKHQWDEEDAARDELELEARRKFLEQEANEIFTSMTTYFTSLAKALRAIGASVEIGEHWEHVRDQTLRRTTKLVSAGQQLHVNLTVQGTSIFYRDRSYRIPRGIEDLILIITSDVEQFLDTLSVSPKECEGELCRHTISQPHSIEVSSFNKTLWLEALDCLEFHPDKSARPTPHLRQPSSQWGQASCSTANQVRGDRQHENRHKAELVTEVRTFIVLFSVLPQ